MAAHGWRVGLLSEMPPEGKVGVSEVCVLGYNVNAGQEISLRLRTDDLMGFRKYAKIRETLVHVSGSSSWGDWVTLCVCSSLRRRSNVPPSVALTSSTTSANSHSPPPPHWPTDRS
jgi:hypothetical protein